MTIFSREEVSLSFELAEYLTEEATVERANKFPDLKLASISDPILSVFTKNSFPKHSDTKFLTLSS